MGFASKLFVLISGGVALFIAFFFVLNAGVYSALVAILAVILGFLIWVWGATPEHKQPSQDMMDEYGKRLKELEETKRKRDPSKLRAVFDDD